MHNQQNPLSCGKTSSNVKQPDTKVDETEVIMCKNPHRNGTEGHWETILDEAERMRELVIIQKYMSIKGLEMKFQVPLIIIDQISWGLEEIANLLIR